MIMTKTMSKKHKKVMNCALALVLAGTILTGCSGGGGYDKYSAAYNKVTANGGMDADLQVTLKMDGATVESSGNFQLDTSDGNNLLYYELTTDGNKITQFSDGSYIYTEANGHKTKYSMKSKPSTDTDTEKAAQKDSDSTFNTQAFLSEFSSFMEAGKIKELGLLSPIDKAAVSDISEKDGIYTLAFSDSLVKKYLNVMIQNETGAAAGDTIQIDKMENFTYKATVKGDYVTDVEYSGVITVNVPASLMESGKDESYNMDFNIKVSFVNPGEGVDVTIPSTDGYEET